MNFFKRIVLLSGVLVLSLGAVYIALAWTEPTQVPPAGNVPSPLNVGPQLKLKPGLFKLAEKLTVIGTSYLANVNVYGNLGVGVTSPVGKLEVAGLLRISRSNIPGEYIDISAEGGTNKLLRNGRLA